MNFDYRLIDKYNVEDNEIIRLATEVYQEYLGHQLLYNVLGSDAESGDKKYFDVNGKLIVMHKRNFEKLGINNLEIVKKTDVKILFDFIVKEEVHLLKKILQRVNKSELVFVFYSLACYIAEFHGRIYLTMNDANIINEFKGLKNTERHLLSTISILKKEQYKISGLLGMDKAIVQYIFSLILGLPDTVNKSPNILDKHMIIDIFITVAAIIQTIGERELLLSKFYSLQKVQIINSVIEIPKGLYCKFSEFIKDLFNNEQKLGMEDGVSKELFITLDENIFSTMGFKYKTLENFISDIEMGLALDDRLATLVQKEILISIIVKGGQCTKYEAEKLIDYLTIEEASGADYYLATIDKFKTRILKNPLVRVEISNTTAYLFSYPLLFYALFLLRRNIVYDLILEAKGINSKIIKEKVKNKLVEMVFEEVSKHSDICYCNTYDLDVNINSKLRRIHFHREIDALFMVNNKLFITECKDRVFKFTSFGFKKEIGLCIEDINVMVEKYEEVKKYIKELEALFGYQIKEIIMVIVYRHYNAARHSDIDQKDVHIVSITEFEEWLLNII